MPSLPLHIVFALELTKKYKGLRLYPLLVGAVLPDCLHPGDTKSFRNAHCLSGSSFQSDKIIQKFGDVVRHPEDWALMVGWHSHVCLDDYDRKRGLKILGKKKINQSEESRMHFYDNICDYSMQSILKASDDMVRVPTPMVAVLEQMMNIHFKEPQNQLRTVVNYIERRSEREPDKRRKLVRDEVFDKYIEGALEDYPYESLGLTLIEGSIEAQVDITTREKVKQKNERTSAPKSPVAELDPEHEEYDQLNKELDDILKT